MNESQKDHWIKYYEEREKRVPNILSQNGIKYNLGPHGDIYITLNNPCIKECELGVQQYIGNYNGFKYYVKITTYDPNYSQFGEATIWNKLRFYKYKYYTDLNDAINDIQNLSVINIKNRYNKK